MEPQTVEVQLIVRSESTFLEENSKIASIDRRHQRSRQT